jgi:hypothetical protein
MSFNRVFKPESLDIDQLAFEINRLLATRANQVNCASHDVWPDQGNRAPSATGIDLLSGTTRGTNVSREVPTR